MPSLNYTTIQENDQVTDSRQVINDNFEAVKNEKADTTHNHTASDITDFDTEVSNNADVAANTAARHVAVTVADSAEIDLTLAGQQISASIVAGSIDESKLDASVNTSLDLADSASQPGHIHAQSDVTNLVTDLANKQDNISGDTITSATVATDDKVLIQDTSDADNLKTVTAQSIADLSGGGGTPGGSNTQVQFNDGGSFGGDTELTYDKTSNILYTPKVRGRSGGDLNLANFNNTVYVDLNNDGTLNLETVTNDVLIEASSLIDMGYNADSVDINCPLQLYGGSASGAPLRFVGTTLATTPVDGTIEMDANCFYGTTDAGNRGYIPVRHFIRADSSRSLTDTVSEQALFNSPANGRLTLETGTYLFEGLISLSGMSATAGNAAIDILGNGTATAGTWLWTAQGRDASSATEAAAVTGSFTVTQQSVNSIVSAGTGTGLQIAIQGTFEVTGGGTIVPSITLLTGGVTPTLAAGSYLVFERIGSTSVVSVGQWD